MKRIITLILALALCLSLAACGLKGSIISELTESKPSASNDAPAVSSDKEEDEEEEEADEEAEEEAEEDGPVALKPGRYNLIEGIIAGVDMTSEVNQTYLTIYEDGRGISRNGDYSATFTWDEDTFTFDSSGSEYDYTFDGEILVESRDTTRHTFRYVGTDTSVAEPSSPNDIDDWMDALEACGFEVRFKKTGDGFRNDYLVDPDYGVARIDSLITASAEDGWALSFVEPQTVPWEGEIIFYRMDSESSAKKLYAYLIEETDSYGEDVHKNYTVEKNGYAVTTYTDVTADESRCIAVARNGSTLIVILCGNETVDANEAVDRILQKVGFDLN